MRTSALRGPGPARAAIAILAATLLLTAARTPCYAGDEVVLKSGKVLQGRVNGSETVAGTRMLKVETDFGQVLVPAQELKAKKPEKAGDGVFACEQIRVVRIVGKVERRAGAGEPWSVVVWSTDYEKAANVPNGLIKPGDTIRTDKDATIEFMPHKDVWVRVGPSSEVEIVHRGGGATLGLLKGDLLQKIEGKPRGEKVEVQGKGLVGPGQGARWDAGTFELFDLGDPERRAFVGRIARLPLDDMVCIPAGEYGVGSAGVPQDADEPIVTSPGNNLPKTLLKLDTYLIDRREVTVGELSDFLFAMDLAPTGIADWAPGGQERRPASYVSWDVADAFARWCGKALPWEAQWEVAARGPKMLEHPWGSPHDKRQDALIAGTWHDEAPRWVRPPNLPTVDAPTFDVSPFGLRSMSSSVPEWCRDWWSDLPWQKGDPRGPPTGTIRLVRGFGGSKMKIGSVILRVAMPPGTTLGAPGFRCSIDLGG
jgi:formylglycine-generating enzyme required for sulfatase activity